MKKILMLCFTLLAANMFADINWKTNYQEALQEAKSKNVPLVLFFTGSDWCGWCHKLEDESLNTKEFENATKDKFVFVELDYPRGTKLPQNIAAQNENLRQKYNVKGYPTLVIIDNQERKLGDTGYRAGGGAQYAQHLMSIAGQK